MGFIIAEQQITQREQQVKITVLALLIISALLSYRA